ncbi:MAG: DUF302 domain-containing protein [Deltaproteobacteria bacterium]|nr:DUF302 domain-containing protein [Deltaproteobacteria bacterium]
MIYKLESKKDFEVVVKEFEEAAKRHKFGVLANHNVKETLNSKGVEFAPECRIVEICNPHQAKKVLEANLDISTALPCRVAIYKDKGKVTLSMIKPTALLSMFPNPELKNTAEEVEKEIMEIMKEAA